MPALKYIIFILLFLSADGAFAQLHRADTFNDKNLLVNFLKSPIKSITIDGKEEGCFSSRHYHMDYRKTKGTYLRTDTVIEENYRDKMPRFKNSVDTKALYKILQKINQNPTRQPAIRDFEIQDTDKQNYISFVNGENVHITDGCYYTAFHIDPSEKPFLLDAVSQIDTISDAFLRQIFDDIDQLGISTTYYTFQVTITNQNNEHLIIKQEYECTMPWLLPCNIQYKEHTFTCYYVALSRFISSCLPDQFIGKHSFNNIYVLAAIARYYKRHQP